MSKKGFAIVEIMIVLLIIGLVISIAVPSFIREKIMAQRNSCRATLKQIYGAVQVWALDTNTPTSATFTTSNLVPNYLKAWPKEGTVNYPVPANVGTVPVCAIGAADHTI